jgi:hypothetical protein
LNTSRLVVTNSLTLALTGISSSLSNGTIVPIIPLAGIRFDLSHGSLVSSSTLGNLTGNSITSGVGPVTYNAEGDKTSNLSGVSEASEVNTFAQVQIGPTGVLESTEITGLAGTIAADNHHGVKTTGFVGTLTIDNSEVITSVSSLTDVGFAINQTPEVVLTGAACSGDVGSLGVIISPTETTIVGVSAQVLINFLASLEIDIGPLANNLFQCFVGIITTSPDREAALIGVTETGSVGTVTYSANTDLSFSLSSTYILSGIGHIGVTGSIPFKQGGGLLPYKIPKRPSPKPDYALLWILKVVGNEEEYLGSKIRKYHPTITEDMLSNTINNIITMMQSFFTENPRLIMQSQVDKRESEVIAYWSLIALAQHNSEITFVAPYRPGLLG